MAVWEDRLYWSDWETKEIASVHKTDGSNRTTLVRHEYKFYGITIFHQQMMHDVSLSKYFNLWILSQINNLDSYFKGLSLCNLD